MKRKKFVITAISGNEEKWVVQWCKSVMKANPDKVIINLNQYDDNSEKLFRENIPEDKLVLVKFPWKKDFSEARNHTLDLVPEDTDYVMYLDLDEVITDDSYPMLEAVLRDEKIEPSLLICNIYNNVNQTSMLASLYYPRIFPHIDGRGRLYNERFEGEVHNQLMYDPKYRISGVRVPVSIMHYGYSLSSQEMAKKHKRSEELLRNQIKENPDNFFAHLNLAQLLRAKEDIIGADHHARETLRIIEKEMPEKPHLIHNWIMAKEQLVTTLIKQRKYDEAIVHSEAVLAKKPDHLDSIMNLAHTHLERGDLEKAEFWYRRYLFVSKNYDETQDNTNIILNQLNSGFIAFYHLGVISLFKNDLEESLKHFKTAYELEPLFRDVFLKYIEVLRQLQRYGEFDKELHNFLVKYPDRNWIIYEYLSNTDLTESNVENAKFNLYQAVHLTKDENEKKRLQSKFDTLTKIFGPVPRTYTDISNKQKKLINKTKG